MRKAFHEFLPRNHSSKYGVLDKSNWKDLRVRANWKRIDPAIIPLLRSLNEHGFRTFSSCSGGHKRNLNYPDVDHEAGYVCFFPTSKIAYNLYSIVKNKHRRFDFTASTEVIWERRGSKRLESTKLGWQLQSRDSRRKYYYALFDDMMAQIEKMARSDKVR